MYNDFNCDSISYCAKILNIYVYINEKRTYIRMFMHIYTYIYVHTYASIEYIRIRSDLRGRI